MAARECSASRFPRQRHAKISHVMAHGRCGAPTRFPPAASFFSGGVVCSNAHHHGAVKLWGQLITTNPLSSGSQPRQDSMSSARAHHCGNSLRARTVSPLLSMTHSLPGGGTTFRKPNPEKRGTWSATTRTASFGKRK